MEIKECKVCGSDTLGWDIMYKNNSGVVNGLLSTHDISTIFFLACNRCGGTLYTIGENKVIEILDSNLSRDDELARLREENERLRNHPKIVCLCGSTRFYDAFQEANYDETMKGRIVLSVGFYPHSKAEHGHGEGIGHDSAEKFALDELHKRKIDICDEVLVLNVGGYIGDSTRSEIEYAQKIGKPIRYLNAEQGGE